MVRSSMRTCVLVTGILCCLTLGTTTHSINPSLREIQTGIKPSQSRGDNSDYKVVCYFGYNGQPYNSTLPPGLNVKICTHLIIFASYILNSQVHIDNSTYLSKIPLIKKMNPSLKVLCCNGGSFKDVLATEANRTRFAKSAAPVLRKYGFDGMDLDWEFPAYMPDFNLTDQKHNFTLAVQALRKEFEKEAQESKNPRLLLTAAVAGVDIIILRSYEVDQLAKYLDFINLMTYDTHYFLPVFPFTGYNSPLHPSDDFLDKTIFRDFNTAWSANQWAKLGMDKTQIMVGVPFYGHQYQLADASSHGLYALAKDIGPQNEIGYSQICHIVKDPKSNVVWDNSSLVPYLYRDTLWISYDNIKSITYKVQWTIENKFGGTMVFSTPSDDYTGACDGKTKWPLLTTVYNIVHKHSKLPT